MSRVVDFVRKSDGLTTIEWVAVCAIVLVGAIAISTAITGGAGQLGNSVAGQMQTAADDVDDDN